MKVSVLHQDEIKFEVNTSKNGLWIHVNLSLLQEESRVGTRRAFFKNVLEDLHH